MVGVQNERHIQRLFGGGRGLFTVQHQQEVAGMGERRIGLHHRLAFADAVIGGHDHGDLRGQSDGLGEIAVVVDLLGVGVVKRQRGNGGAQDFHGRGRFRHRAHDIDDGGVEFAGRPQAQFQVVKFGPGGQFAQPQQITRLFKRGMISQFVNVDAPIGKNSFFAVNVTNAGIGCDDAFKTPGCRY